MTLTDQDQQVQQLFPKAILQKEEIQARENLSTIKKIMNKF